MIPLLLTVTLLFQQSGPAVIPALAAPTAPADASGPGPADTSRGPGADTGTGKALFGHNCSRCHGNDGTKGFFGAKNLQISRLSDSAITVQILNGKKFMPSFRKRLSPDEIQSLTQYVKTLRTH